MNRILLGIFLASSLYAQGYRELLELAINNNINLQQIKSQQDILLLKGEIETRYTNPNMELEVSSFSQDEPLGLRVGINQEILLPSFKKEIEILTNRQISLSKEQLKLSRLEFIYLFAMRYIEYREAIAKVALEQDVLALSEEIFSIADKRFTHGSISKSEWLQVKLDRAKILTQIKELDFFSLQKRNELLKFGNLDNSLEIDTNYYFSSKGNITTHPQIELYKKEQEIAKSKLKLASYDIESIELFSEIESEPNQEILRIGISIPLPIVHHKSQERQLAKIALQNQTMQITSKERSILLQIEQLQNEIGQIHNLKESYQNRIVEEQELLDMYKRGYQVAQVNLLKLNRVKRELLESKLKLLQANIEIEKKEIKIEYLQGEQSE